jgi:hypothetical protein
VRSAIAFGRIHAAVDAEGDHPAVAAHLLAGQRVAGVVDQAWVGDASHLRMVGQELRDPHRVVVVPIHPHAEGLQAAQGEPGVERAGDGADGVLEERELLCGGRIGADRAPDHVGVSADVLGRRVDHEVGAELERLLEVGRGEGVVGDQLAPAS